MSFQALFFLRSQSSLPIRASFNDYKLAIVYPTSHVRFGVRVDGGDRGRGKAEKVQLDVLLVNLYQKNSGLERYRRV